MKFLRSVLAQNESVTADTVVTYDLPVNPLSHIILTLNFLNATDLATLAELLAAIDTIRVIHRGQSIISLSQADLWALSAYLLMRGGLQGNGVDTDNAARWISINIPFGRVLYNPEECFPATRAGELQLQIDYASSFTGFDNVTAQIETVELLGANPRAHLKYTTLSLTPVVGDNDLDMPIGNPYAGVLLFSTTVPTGTATTKSISQVKLLIDNTEAYYSQANWESLRGDAQWRIGALLNYNAEIHLAAGATADTNAKQFVDDELESYAYLDFDPLLDSSYLLETKQASSVKLRLTAEDTNAVRAIPVEIKTV